MHEVLTPANAVASIALADAWRLGAGGEPSRDSRHLSREWDCVSPGEIRIRVRDPFHGGVLGQKDRTLGLIISRRRIQAALVFWSNLAWTASNVASICRSAMSASTGCAYWVGPQRAVGPQLVGSGEQCPQIPVGQSTTSLYFGCLDSALRFVSLSADADHVRGVDSRCEASA